MKLRHASDAPLPRTPLDFAYPLVVRGPGAEGAVVLAEVAGERALAVLRVLRRVLDWSRGGGRGAPGVRAHVLERWEADRLHEEGCRDPLAPALTALAGEVERGEEADAESVARGCLDVCDWALGAGAEGTALLFAEAAALASPANARFAWTAGRMLRDAGRHREAVLWLRRAARVAVWSADWEAQDLALNSLGNLYAQQGGFGEALQLLVRAVRLARRHRMREREGAVTHDLFAVFVLTGEHARAEEAALDAFDLYGPGHPNLPKLAHDVVQLWLRQGRFPVALPVLSAVLPHLHLPEERLRVLASIVRTAGALEDRSTYESTWIEAWELVHLPTAEVRATLPGVLVDLGYGAASVKDWDHAAASFTRALEIADQMGANDDAETARKGLESVQRNQGVETPRRKTSGPAAHRLLHLTYATVWLQPRNGSCE
ncbi:MAG TPA: tetratricopeptide repeat protein [Longimicrobium sp.]|nr:tetratricopeptide repeat protein [Longimicrobium sp.]